MTDDIKRHRIKVGPHGDRRALSRAKQALQRQKKAMLTKKVEVGGRLVTTQLTAGAYLLMRSLAEGGHEPELLEADP